MHSSVFENAVFIFSSFDEELSLVPKNHAGSKSKSLLNANHAGSKLRVIKFPIEGSISKIIDGIFE